MITPLIYLLEIFSCLLKSMIVTERNGLPNSVFFFLGTQLNYIFQILLQLTVAMKLGGFQLIETGRNNVSHF